MKGKLIALASILCIASLIISGANAKGKPDHSNGPGQTKTELIVFQGDLVGKQDVKGCCLNRGPFPEYVLTLPVALVGKNVNYPAFDDDGQVVEYDGQVFMSHSSVGKDRKYIVQFWTSCHGGLDCEDPDHMCIEVNGGVEDYDRKTKVRKVTFDEVDWNTIGDRNIIQGKVSFVLTRTPN